MKLIFRALGLPFIMILTLIALVYHFIRLTGYYVMYGGEFIIYQKKNQKKQIEDIYFKLVELEEKKQED